MIKTSFQVKDRVVITSTGYGLQGREGVIVAFALDDWGEIRRIKVATDGFFRRRMTWIYAGDVCKIMDGAE